MTSSDPAVYQTVQMRDLWREIEAGKGENGKKLDIKQSYHASGVVSRSLDGSTYKKRFTFQVVETFPENIHHPAIIQATYDYDDSDDRLESSLRTSEGEKRSIKVKGHLEEKILVVEEIKF